MRACVPACVCVLSQSFNVGTQNFNMLFHIKVARTSSTFGIVQSRPRSRQAFENISVYHSIEYQVSDLSFAI